MAAAREIRRHWLAGAAKTPLGLVGRASSVLSTSGGGVVNVRGPQLPAPPHGHGAPTAVGGPHTIGTNRPATAVAGATSAPHFRWYRRPAVARHHLVLAPAAIVSSMS